MLSNQLMSDPKIKNKNFLSEEFQFLANIENIKEKYNRGMCQQILKIFTRIDQYISLVCKKQNHTSILLACHVDVARQVLLGDQHIYTRS